MSEQFLQHLDTIKKINQRIQEYLWKNNIKSKIEEYQKLILDEKFWKDQLNAQKKLKEKKKLDYLVSSFKNSVK